jgi:hypothetical protein
MEPAKSKFDVSLEGGPHSRLAALIGDWKGTSRVWFGKDNLADESPVSGTITSILGGRFILHQYTTSMSGDSVEGLVVIGYSIESGKYQTAWVDSFHMGTAIMFSEGSGTESGHSVLGSYGGAEMPEPWGWRTAIEVLDPRKIVITAYNIAPGGVEEKATEIVYDRVNEDESVE